MGNSTRGWTSPYSNLMELAQHIAIEKCHHVEERRGGGASRFALVNETSIAIEESLTCLGRCRHLSCEFGSGCKFVDLLKGVAPLTMKAWVLASIPNQVVRPVRSTWIVGLTPEPQSLGRRNGTKPRSFGWMTAGRDQSHCLIWRPSRDGVTFCNIVYKTRSFRVLN